MYENKSTRKKPLSLNDSHYRLLQDLSSPPMTKPKPSFETRYTEAKPSQVKLEGGNHPYEEIVDDTITQRTNADLRELFSLPKQGFDISLTQQQLEGEHDSQNLFDESLRTHIEFLKHQGIAGTSHHSLLFSKTLPVQLASDEEVMRGNFAFKPKDTTLQKKASSPDSCGKLMESEIKNKIKCFSQTLALKDMVSRLPDKGNRLRMQIAELRSKLHKITMTKRTDVIVEDISGALQSSLYV